jgi:hypothetical protein
MPNADDFMDYVEAKAKALGMVWEELGAEFRLFVGDQATQLAALSGRVDHEAYIAAADIAAHRVLQRGLNRTVTGMDATDAQLWGFISGGLAFLGSIISGGAA